MVFTNLIRLVYCTVALEKECEIQSVPRNFSELIIFMRGVAYRNVEDE